ncbi:hypothetical protein DPEC_G00038380 [Dallia pectoralis]|uniref:Uncharacterized protein n=1 Tax=Dallia pectoralis TaxID=75939 RepID=A0ACC2HEU3_DALPE|nr:hypothetical protein DPEC_G00038380 [Dallia pectoralis]
MYVVDREVKKRTQASHVHQKDQVTSQDRRMKNLFSHVSPGFHEPHLESLHGHSTAFVRSLRMTSPDEAELGAYLRMDGIPGEEGGVQGIKSSTTDNVLYRRLANIYKLDIRLNICSDKRTTLISEKNSKK